MIFRIERGPSLALASALLFGATTPFAKLLIGTVHPALLAGLFYLGSGLGLFIYRIVHTARPPSELLQGWSRFWLALAILSGGILGPLLLMFGLVLMSASSASLLLNLEGVFTALLAWFVFHENFDRRIALGMASIIAGSLLLSWPGNMSVLGLLGPLCIAGACLAWAIDNNLTRKVSLSDPAQIAMLKGLVAGPVNIAAGIVAGGWIPSAGVVAMAACIGFLGYGVSLVLFVLALRELGTARTAAYYSTAPFVGAAISLAMFGEPLSIPFLSAVLLMLVGIWLHLTERHAHLHVHTSLTHTHSHVHDIHHRHAHRNEHPPGEPHSHEHAHARLRHTHRHFPDSHHTHDH